MLSDPARLPGSGGLRPTKRLRYANCGWHLTADRIPKGTVSRVLDLGP